MKFTFDNGGSTAALRGDCVTRAVAIASGKPYAEVYAALSDGVKSERGATKRSARSGIKTGRKWFKDYMLSAGFTWTPTMGIGTGCKVHLKDGELPMGRLVVMVSKHAVAVIDGEMRDLSDCSRDGTRCVYGYWTHTKDAG